jgi:hypothetical protein
MINGTITYSAEIFVNMGRKNRQNIKKNQSREVKHTSTRGQLTDTYQKRESLPIGFHANP